MNLYAAGSAEIDLAGRVVKVTQATRYPWDGAVTMTVTPDRARAFTMKVRIPGWARNELVPSDLYRFLDKPADVATVKVNGRPVEVKLDKGYATIARTWRAGDVVDINLPMPVRRIIAHEQVAADRDRVALQRGPIVYAAEWPDNPEGKVRNLVLADSNDLTTEFRTDLLNGVQIIKGRALALALDEQGAVRKAEQPFMAIPYATWANRGRGEMTVWIPRTEAVARPAPYPTLATSSTLRTSRPQGQGFLQGIVDGEEPRNSRAGGSMFNWWPLQGWSEACEPGAAAGQPRRQCSKGEWIDMTFAKPATVSESQIYWFDDAPGGGVRVPASWKLLYKDGEQWKPVETVDPLGVAKDAWNKVTFKPVSTSALRLEIVLQPGVSAGLQEWRVK